MAVLDEAEEVVDEADLEEEAAEVVVGAKDDRLNPPINPGSIRTQRESEARRTALDGHPRANTIATLNSTSGESS